MTHRGHGEGTITQRQDGRWEARVTLPDSGKRKCLYGTTRQEVAHKLNLALRELARGATLDSERLTVEQHLEAWLQTKRATRTYRTWQGYDELARLHVYPTLGRCRLARLAPQQLARLYAAKLAEGLSPARVRHLHVMLHGALAHAVRLALVARNVCDLVDAPTLVKAEPRPTWTAGEVRRFLDTAQSSGDRLAALYVLAVTTGMRQGELLGLRWRDVDLDTGGLQVVGSMQRGEGGARVRKAPKTASSRRSVVLVEEAIAALRTHRTQQRAERLAAGEAWESAGDLVFCSSIGTPLDPTTLVRRSFVPLLRAAGVPHIRFHDLRHTVATLLLGMGTQPKLVSELLGHSDVTTTMRVYGHVTPTLHQHAMLAYGRLLRGEQIG